MSKTGKDVTWNRLFGSDPNFAKDEIGRTIASDYDRGYADALDAAEAAVKALIHSSMCDCESCWWKADALDAIRALREKP